MNAGPSSRSRLAVAVTAMVLSAAALLLFSGAPAGAAACEGSPGLSGLQQYCESVPSAAGDRSPIGRSGSGGGSPAGGSGIDPVFSPRGVAPAVLRALRRDGPQGRELATRLRAPKSRRDRAAAPDPTPRATPTGVRAQAGGLLDGWAAGTKPIGLLAAALAALTGLTLVGFGVRRSRRAGDGEGPE